MAVAMQPQFFTVEEYFALEEHADHRSEYFGGEVFAMAGGTANHNRIARNAVIALGGALAGKPCEVFVSDMRLLVKRAKLYTYPDVMVICGGIDFAPKRQDTVTNPVVLFEVLSPSTEACDRGKKFESYRTLTSLKEYVLVDQDRVHIEHYRLVDKRQWVLAVLDDASERMALDSIGVELSLTEIYEQVVWEPE